MDEKARKLAPWNLGWTCLVTALMQTVRDPYGEFMMGQRPLTPSAL